MRNFAPTRFGLKSDFFAELIEQRLSHSGEYVYHIPAGGDQQPVVMNYQYIPVDATINPEYMLSGANPKLYGLAEHFQDLPKVYKEGDSARPTKGSQFEVRGLIYNVKKVEINHRGYIHIELVQDNSCTEVRQDFFEEVQDLLCTPNECADDEVGDVVPPEYGDCGSC